MKIERFSLADKGTLFHAHSMHDCSFTVIYENKTLVLIYDHLDRYDDAVPWFSDKKLTVKYHDTRSLDLQLRYGTREKNYYGTVGPLQDKELIMYKFSIDTFDQMALHFNVFIKKKLWGGKIEIAPGEIEYIWE